MKDQVIRTEYFTLPAEDKPGMGADFHKRLGKEGVNLLSVLAFPIGPGKTQVDLVPENPEVLAKAARKLGVTLEGPKACFLVQGNDRPGALGEVLDRLGTAKINVRATAAIVAGGHRYGCILWVAPADVESATRALGASVTAHA